MTLRPKDSFYSLRVVRAWHLKARWAQLGQKSWLIPPRERRKNAAAKEKGGLSVSPEEGKNKNNSNNNKTGNQNKQQKNSFPFCSSSRRNLLCFAFTTPPPGEINADINCWLARVRFLIPPAVRPSLSCNMMFIAGKICSDTNLQLISAQQRRDN